MIPSHSGQACGTDGGEALMQETGLHRARPGPAPESKRFGFAVPAGVRDGLA